MPLQENKGTRAYLSPFQMAQLPQQQFSECEEQTPSHNSRDCSRNSSPRARVVGFQASPTVAAACGLAGSAWSPVSVLQDEQANSGPAKNGPSSMPRHQHTSPIVSRQSSLAEALHQRQRLDALQSQTSWPGLEGGGARLTIRTKVNNRTGGGSRGNTRLAQLQLQRSRSSHVPQPQSTHSSHTHPSTSRLGGTDSQGEGAGAEHPHQAQQARLGPSHLLTRRKSMPQQGQHARAGDTDADTGNMARKTSATLDIPAHARMQKATTCPEELTDDVIAAAIAAAHVHGPCGSSRWHGSANAGSSRAASTAGHSPPPASHRSARSRHSTPPLPRVHGGVQAPRSHSSTATSTSSCMTDTPPTQRAQHARQRSGSMWGSPHSECSYCCHQHDPSSPSHGRFPGEAGSSMRELFEARSAAATAHAQVQCLNVALNQEREEAEQLRRELQRVAMERDELRQAVTMRGGHLGRQAGSSRAGGAFLVDRAQLHGSSSHDVFRLEETEE